MSILAGSSPFSASNVTFNSGEWFWKNDNTLLLQERTRDVVSTTFTMSAGSISSFPTVPLQLRREIKKVFEKRVSRLLELLPADTDLKWDFNKQILTHWGNGIKLLRIWWGGWLIVQIKIISPDKSLNKSTWVKYILDSDEEITEISMARWPRSEYTFGLNDWGRQLITDFDKSPTCLPLFETWRKFLWAFEEIDAAITKIEAEQGVTPPETQPT